jgi:hypothetical protein
VVITGVVVVALLLSASAACAQTTGVLALVASVDQALTNIRNWVMAFSLGWRPSF